jgi:hypothetical protein
MRLEPPKDVLMLYQGLTTLDVTALIHRPQRVWARSAWSGPEAAWSETLRIAARPPSATSPVPLRAHLGRSRSAGELPKADNPSLRRSAGSAACYHFCWCARRTRYASIGDHRCGPGSGAPFRRATCGESEKLSYTARSQVGVATGQPTFRLFRSVVPSLARGSFFPLLSSR